MWKYLKFILPLIMVCLVPMVLPGPDGKPIMTVQDWLPDKSTLNSIENQIKKVVNKTAEVAPGIEGAGPLFAEKKQQIYKWQDKNGNWQFTDNLDSVPEYALSQLQAEQMPKAMNTMPAPEIQEKPAAAANKEAMPFNGGEVGVDKLPQLVEEAKKAKALMEERNKTLEGI